uniref:Uncharacterized protein n=1 Tax=Cyclopterus lumpus TaxID=8103 RepID=A0A8C2XNT4_CYCLU
MTTQICLTHSIMDCGVPATVMARSVELAPPPLPMSEPHWLAGTTRRMVTGGLLVAVLLVIEVLMSCREGGMTKRVKGGKKKTKLESVNSVATTCQI